MSRSAAATIAGMMTAQHLANEVCRSKVFQLEPIDFDAAKEAGEAVLLPPAKLAYRPKASRKKHKNQRAQRISRSRRVGR